MTLTDFDQSDPIKVGDRVIYADTENMFALAGQVGYVKRIDDGAFYIEFESGYKVPVLESEIIRSPYQGESLEAVA